MTDRHLIDGAPIAHVAREFRVSWDTVKKWVSRFLDQGEPGLADRPSTPWESPTTTEACVVARIEALRRELKWSATRIHHHLAAGGVDPLPEHHALATGQVHDPVQISARTVGRWLHRLARVL